LASRRARLAKLIDHFDAETVVAVGCAVSVDPSLEPMTAATLKQVLHECPDDEFLVFEQDRAEYVIPLGKWMIAVNVGSPLREGLDRCNAEWLEEVKGRLLGPRTLEGLEASHEEPRQATPTSDEWLRCPHCGMSFALRDRQRWDGQRHQTCGGRISLSDPLP
jgi:hypothetical protein